VVLEVLADSWEVDFHWDVQLVQEVRRADAGYLK
jgi:hypothetical protein